MALAKYFLTIISFALKVKIMKCFGISFQSNKTGIQNLKWKQPQYNCKINPNKTLKMLTITIILIELNAWMCFNRIHLFCIHVNGKVRSVANVYYRKVSME